MTEVTVVYRLFHPLGVAPPQALPKPKEMELSQARILVRCIDTQEFSALLGDKYLFWIPDERNAFIMFATTSQFRIAMGDPVGELAEINELLY